MRVVSAANGAENSPSTFLFRDYTGAALLCSVFPSLLEKVYITEKYIKYFLKRYRAAFLPLPRVERRSYPFSFLFTILPVTPASRTAVTRETGVYISPHVTPSKRFVWRALIGATKRGRHGREEIKDKNRKT